MKIIFLLIGCILIGTFDLKSQINLDSFTKSIIRKNKDLEHKREYDIDKFMKYGYKKNPDLRSNNICKIPVYSIFCYSKFVNSKRIKDSLFTYLNPESICIDNILFCKNKQFFAIAYSKYLNVKEQPIGSGNALNAKLTDIIIKERPDILFSLSQSDRIYFFLKENLLFCYLFDEKQDDFIRMTPKEFLEAVDTFEFYFMTHLDKPFPLIYSK